MERHGALYPNPSATATGTFWLYVVTDASTQEVLHATGESVGADFGMKDDAFLTLNTGEKIQHPQPLKQSLTELRKLNKSPFSQSQRLSQWWRAVRELARPLPQGCRSTQRLAVETCQRPCVVGLIPSPPRRVGKSAVLFAKAKQNV